MKAPVLGGTWLQGNLAFFLSDQHLLHQLFVINLFLLFVFANQLKMKGSELEGQVYLNML